MIRIFLHFPLFYVARTYVVLYEIKIMMKSILFAAAIGLLMQPTPTGACSTWDLPCKAREAAAATAWAANQAAAAAKATADAAAATAKAAEDAAAATVKAAEDAAEAAKDVANDAVDGVVGVANAVNPAKYDFSFLPTLGMPDPDAFDLVATTFKDTSNWLVDVTTAGFEAADAAITDTLESVSDGAKTFGTKMVVGMKAFASLPTQYAYYLKDATLDLATIASDVLSPGNLAGMTEGALSNLNTMISDATDELPMFAMLSVPQFAEALANSGVDVVLMTATAAIDNLFEQASRSADAANKANNDIWDLIPEDIDVPAIQKVIATLATGPAKSFADSMAKAVLQSTGKIDVAQAWKILAEEPIIAKELNRQSIPVAEVQSKSSAKVQAAAGDGIVETSAPATPASLTFEIELDGDISKMTATELTDAKAAAKAAAAAAGKFDPSTVDKIVFTQNGVEIGSNNRRRRAEANGPITITVIFKIGAAVDLDAALNSLNDAIAGGHVSLDVTIGGNTITGTVTKAATAVAAVVATPAGAATVSAKMATALAALTVVAAAW